MEEYFQEEISKLIWQTRFFVLKKECVILIVLLKTLLLCFRHIKKISEAVVQKCSVKKVFLEISPQACNFIKKGALVQVFSCEFCKISQNTFSYRTPLVAASEDFPKILAVTTQKMKFSIKDFFIFYVVSTPENYMLIWFV